MLVAVRAGGANEYEDTNGQGTEDDGPAITVRQWSARGGAPAGPSKQQQECQGVERQWPRAAGQAQTAGVVARDQGPGDDERGQRADEDALGEDAGGDRRDGGGSGRWRRRVLLPAAH